MGLATYRETLGIWVWLSDKAIMDKMVTGEAEKQASPMMSWTLVGIC